MSEYEVFAIKYGRHERRATENFLGGDPHDGPQPIDFFVWAIIGKNRSIIVDTGFDHAMAERRNREITWPVGEGLKAIGIDPAAIKDIIITHLHYDHAGNHDLFPHARYHLQDCEMAYATGRCMCHAALRLPFEADDVLAMIRKVFAGRVAFHDGIDEIAPDVTAHRAGGHSAGLQCVRVNTRRGPIVLASDATHLYAHIEQGRIFPVVYSVADVVASYEMIKKLAPMSHIVPGHDPLVLEMYPAAKPGLEGWIVRLDVDPKPR
jgi:glyoxylase-like metal-dependent hydrolase (beta-lactamase superfamily II)